MTDKYAINTISLSGFRAYLVPRLFDFRKKRSLAIFAPNGKGKSSLVDGFEFMFSDEGTLERLGLRTTQNKAGHVALAHNMAEARGIESSVEISVSCGKHTDSGKRLASGSERSAPTIATALQGAFVVTPIIRGYELRRFVEERTAEQRYEDVVKWLDLGPLLAVQQNLRELRRKSKAAAESKEPLKQIDTQLAKKTSNALRVWDESAVIAYCNRLLSSLDPDLVLKHLTPFDDAVSSARDRAKVEAEQIGVAGLQQIRKAVVKLAADPKADAATSGLIIAFSKAVEARDSAALVAEKERETAANAVFEAVWRHAAVLFEDNATAPAVCPVCDTPVVESKAGSPEAIRQHIDLHRQELAAFAKAREGLELAQSKLKTQRDSLGISLSSLDALLVGEQKSLQETLQSYLSALSSWTVGEPPDSAPLLAVLNSYLAEIDESIDGIVRKQGDSTYFKVHSKLDEMIELAADHRRVVRELEELGKLNDELTSQSKHIAGEIRKEVQKVLDSLEEPMNAIYARIQNDAAIPVRFELPNEEDTAQQRLGLVVDFATNREGVTPSGYLSDSQIHSLALALRMAAVKMCNAKAPILILDDIVTSYDADHRLAVTALLAEQFSDFQTILVTHDERFFAFLKDHLGDRAWQYKRILQLTPDGPRLHDDRVSDEMIEERWSEGKSAANDMRQAEEEWLLSVCRDFGVDVKIRSVERAYSYERSELAEALAKFLTSRGLTPPLVSGVNNRFLTSLQKGDVENFGSHFQDAQYGSGSLGDEKVRWQEFRSFRDAFSCRKCGKTRFKRPTGLNKPVCNTEKCETQFEFPAAPSAIGAA